LFFKAFRKHLQEEIPFPHIPYHPSHQPTSVYIYTMKLIVAGSTGFVGTEVIRQALSNPAITSIIALARRETPVPQSAGPDVAKLKSVVCSDFSSYSEDVKKELAGADACIWYITSQSFTFIRKGF
jgi:hypothetical protein